MNIAGTVACVSIVTVFFAIRCYSKTRAPKIYADDCECPVCRMVLDGEHEIRALTTATFPRSGTCLIAYVSPAQRVHSYWCNSLIDIRSLSCFMP